MSPYYDNPGEINDEAVNLVDGRSFPVFQLADSDGNIIDPLSATGEVTITGPVTVSNEVEITNEDGNPVPVTIPGLKIPDHDYVSLSYTGSNLTGVVYKTGGSSGTTVASLALVYDVNNNLISVTNS